MITLYELCGAERDRRFSPFCWRARYALAHKGLDYQITEVRFGEKDAIAFSGQDKVPVLRHGDFVVSDSWAIAEYLENAFPERPSLFAAGHSHALFTKHWLESGPQISTFKAVAKDIHDHQTPEDQAYFRRSREPRLGSTLEALDANADQEIAQLRQQLEPVRRLLATQPYLAGDAPDMSDYLLAANFCWARGISKKPMLATDDPVADWRTRMFDQIGVRNEKGYD